MKGEFLPQYAAQACCTLEKFAKQWGNSARKDAAAMQNYLAGIAGTIRDATHIVLPDRGEVYRSWENQQTPDYEITALAHLPGPICTFEFKSTGMAKVVIACSGKQLGLYESDDVDDDRVIIMDVAKPTGAEERRVAIDSSGAADVWLPPDCAVHIFTKDSCKPAGKIAGIAASQIVCSVQPGPWMSEDEARRIAESPKEFSDCFGRDIFAVSQACVAMRANATLEERIETSATRRWRFEKRGVGGFSYHVIKLPSSAGGGQHELGGSHASPRFHVRRAHIRKLPAGALTFVRQCFVGDPVNGVVKKHYVVRSASGGPA